MIETTSFESSKKSFDFEEENKTDSKLSEFYHTYAKEEKYLRLSDLLHLLLDKNALTNKFSFDFVLANYFSIVKEENEMKLDKFLKLMHKMAKSLYSELPVPVNHFVTLLKNEKLNFKNWKSVLNRKLSRVSI